MLPAKYPSTPTVTTRELYPNLTEEQLQEAEENLTRYIMIVYRAFLRLEQEAPVHSRRL